MKNKILKIIEIILVILIISICIITIFNKSLLNNKINLIICLIIPFILLFSIEIIKIVKDISAKKERNKDQITEMIGTKENVKINEVIENKLEENQEKEQISENTVQIPIKEIQEQIQEINKNLNKVEELEQTKILFTKGEIKEILKQDIESTETVENEEKQNNISTVHVEKNE